MIIRTGRDGFQHPASSEITPQLAYRNRRQWLLAAMAVSGAGAWTGRQAWAQGIERPGRLDPIPSVPSSVPGSRDATTYNNFYEFGTDKSDPARNYAKQAQDQPLDGRNRGLVNKPGTYDMERLAQAGSHGGAHLPAALCGGLVHGDSLGGLFARGPDQARCSRWAAPSTWSSSPWPTRRACRVCAPTCCNGPTSRALRLDEAAHPLTLLAFGMYGEVLPNQNGAPLRLVVPWKYGFKSGKSLVKIRFTDKEPAPHGTWRRRRSTASIPT
jgi:methionine sulfoxide reductase catalytic subunit